MSSSHVPLSDLNARQSSCDTRLPFWLVPQTVHDANSSGSGGSGGVGGDVWASEAYFDT